MPVIYKITSKTSGKSYIGQTKHTAHKRWLKHVQKAVSNTDKQQCWALNNAIRLYGADNFEVETLVECPLEELNDREVALIAEYKTLSPDGYNLSKGGTFRVEVYPEAGKDKISEARRIHKEHDLPRNVYVINDRQGNHIGFGVQYKRKQYGFNNKNVPMEEKRRLAIECLEALKRGEEPERKNKHKHNNDELEIPKYITRYTPNGFAVHTPTMAKRVVFMDKKKTREQNLELAKRFLEAIKDQPPGRENEIREEITGVKTKGLKNK